MSLNSAFFESQNEILFGHAGFCGKSVDEAEVELSECDMICFDLFGILLLEQIGTHRDVFRLMEARLHMPNFTEARMEVEKELLQQKDAVFSDIYGLLQHRYAIDANRAMKMEIDIIDAMCICNPYTKELFSRLKARSKRLVAISDWVLPKGEMVTLLRRRGYEVDEFCMAFAGDEQDTSTERSYPTGIDKQEIIGYVCRHRTEECGRLFGERGWKRVEFPVPQELGGRNAVDEPESITDAVHRGIIRNASYEGIFSRGRYYEFGYKIGGILAMGYFQYLVRYIREHQIDLVMFVSRDMEILHRFYARHCNSTDSVYVRISRFSAYQMSMARYWRRFMEEVIHRRIRLGRVDTVAQALKISGMEYMLPVLFEEDIDGNDLLDEDKYNGMVRLFEKHLVEFTEYYSSVSDAALRYYEKIIQGHKNIVVVDVGWEGTSARIIKYFLEEKQGRNVSVRGLLMGMSDTPTARFGTSTGMLNGYLFEPEKNRDLLLRHYADGDQLRYLLMEILFSEDVPTHLQYLLDDDGGVRLVFGAEEHNGETLKELQDGILDYMETFHRLDFVLGGVSISGREAYRPFDEVVGNHRSYCIDLFRDYRINESTGFLYENSISRLSEIISRKEKWIMKREAKHSIWKAVDDHMDFWENMGYRLIAPFVCGDRECCENEYFFRTLIDLCEKGDAPMFTAKEREIREKVRKLLTKGIEKYKAAVMDFGQWEADAEYASEYIHKHLTRRERFKIAELPVVHEYNGRKWIAPFTVDGRVAFAIVSPWPEDMNAEVEVMLRLQKAAEDVGLYCIVINNDGKIVDTIARKITEKFVRGEDLLFVISTHYGSPKSVDAFTYHTLWNPPEFSLNMPEYISRLSGHYLINDDYLLYDTGRMTDHLRSVLLQKPRTLENASTLMASFPKECILEPRLDDPKMFYCGMNWDVLPVNGGKSRHEGLFRLLDETGVMKIFGPDVNPVWGGVRPWEGFSSYQYPIPFDGFSILKEINDCGICLVLSSDSHRISAAASNRIYEACAAGAVIISDDNEFVERHFKDAALFIEYNRDDPQDMFQQIMEHYWWITEHRTEALELARRAQEIFLERFTADQQLLEIVRNHNGRRSVIRGDLFARNEEKCVLVTAVVNTLDIKRAENYLRPIIKNVENQIYRSICLGVACDETIAEGVKKILSEANADANVISLELYKKKSKRYSDARVIRMIQEAIPHEFWIHADSCECWYCDHITTLVREFEDYDVCAAFSGRFGVNRQQHRWLQWFHNLDKSEILKMEAPQWLPSPGQILFSADCEKEVEDYMLDCVDGYEQYLYLAICWIHYCHPIRFSRRLTFGWLYIEKDKDDIERVMDEDKQKRFIEGLVNYDLPYGWETKRRFDIKNVDRIYSILRNELINW